jgi:hypothetical protein
LSGADVPDWNRAWQALYRSIAHRDGADVAGPGTDRDGDASLHPALQVLHAARRRWCWIRVRYREWVWDAQRKREMAQQAIRNKRRATDKAYSLLLNLLNSEQRQEFEALGHFHVTGGASGDRYRIRIGSVANIDVLQNDGMVKHCLCAYPTGDIPVYDVMAGQMLYLQDPLAEKRFLVQAIRQASHSF